ncbi:MAG: peptide chain release factor N(5)-glutamine methyltransferase [Pseudomonadota bacterium]
MSKPAAADLIAQATKTLAAAGISDANYDAKQLLAAVLAPRDASCLTLERFEIAADDQARFQTLVARRLRREPLQHIVARTVILDLEVKTDARALIPRQDSAAVVLLAETCLHQRQNARIKIADLGTGGGVLLAECLQRFPQATGVAVERSVQAMALAQENFADHNLTARVDFHSGSWATWRGWSDCDLILSNPPYICSDQIASLAPEVREYDPLEALDGGPDGLAAYREIISLASAQMSQGAYLVFEIGYDQEQAVRALLRQSGFGHLQVRQDLGGHNRAIAAIKT